MLYLYFYVLQFLLTIFSIYFVMIAIEILIKQIFNSFSDQTHKYCQNDFSN
jgi:hypothetical protein